MGDPVSAEAAEHYRWGEVCDGWHLVRSEGLSVIEERMPAGAREQRHFHTKARQFFYVLEGELTMEVEGGVMRWARGRGWRLLRGSGTRRGTSRGRMFGFW